MMKLNIITINYNNAEGLHKTLASVASQTYRNIEHIIIDGASTDGSVDVIREYENTIKQSVTIDQSTIQVKWISELDKGIYNAMNKGIEIALGSSDVDAFNRSTLCGDKLGEADRPKGTGVENKDKENKELPDYIQILNSGDVLAAPDVIERIMMEIDKAKYPELLYGNCIDVHTNGTKFSHGPTVEYSLEYLYKSTYPHETTFFRRDVFDKYGLFDESFKIVSDWKWYLQAIGIGIVKPIYVDIDVALFDTSGISSTYKKLDAEERRKVLEENIPPAVLSDLDNYAFPVEQYKRLRKHHLWGLVHLLERLLLRLEKRGVLRK